MAKMGMEVVTILELTGEVILNPMVYKHWLQAKPNTAAPAKSSLSRRGTFSFFVNKAVSQKSMAPPITRIETMLIPSKPWVIASFPNGAMSPQKTSAISILKWDWSGILCLKFIL